MPSEMKLICNLFSESTELVWAHRPSVKGEEVAEEKWMKGSADKTQEQFSRNWVEKSKYKHQA